METGEAYLAIEHIGRRRDREGADERGREKMLVERETLWVGERRWHWLILTIG
jgi:hypothetical protein